MDLLFASFNTVRVVLATDSNDHMEICEIAVLQKGRKNHFKIHIFLIFFSHLIDSQLRHQTDNVVTSNIECM